MARRIVERSAALSACGKGLTDFLGRIKGGVDGDLEARHQVISLGRQGDNCQKLGMLSIGHAFGPGGCRVGMNTVSTRIGYRYGDVDHFFGERIDVRRSPH